jgi:hypothetical protein
MVSYIVLILCALILPTKCNTSVPQCSQQGPTLNLNNKFFKKKLTMKRNQCCSNINSNILDFSGERGDKVGIKVKFLVCYILWKQTRLFLFFNKFQRHNYVSHPTILEARDNNFHTQLLFCLDKYSIILSCFLFFISSSYVDYCFYIFLITLP